MSDELRIRPVDPGAAEGALKEIVAGNRRKWGMPLTPYLLYGRTPPLLKGALAMWDAVRSFKTIDAKLKTMVNRRVAWWNRCPF